MASCKPCGNLIGRSFAIYGAALAGVVVAVPMAPFLWSRLPSSVTNTIKRFLTATKPETKIKILIAFYQIITKVDDVRQCPPRAPARALCLLE